MTDYPFVRVVTDALRRAHRRDEGEACAGLSRWVWVLSAVVHQSLAFKGCTLSHYTTAYDSRGSKVSQTVTVSQSASEILQTTLPPLSPRQNHCLIKKGFAVGF